MPSNRGRVTGNRVQQAAKRFGHFWKFFENIQNLAKRFPKTSSKKNFKKKLRKNCRKLFQRTFNTISKKNSKIFKKFSKKVCGVVLLLGARPALGLQATASEQQWSVLRNMSRVTGNRVQQATTQTWLGAGGMGLLCTDYRPSHPRAPLVTHPWNFTTYPHTACTTGPSESAPRAPHCASRANVTGNGRFWARARRHFPF